MRIYSLLAITVMLVIASPSYSAAALKAAIMKKDLEHIQRWNGFADAVYQLHESQISKTSYTTETRKGGYPMNPDYFIETKYFDIQSGQLISRVSRESKNPEKIHVVEVFIRDKQGRVIRDYLAAYLPVYRNAPIQTLINFHSYQEKLHAFRQFDASGARIYEQCKGTLDGEDVFLSLEEHEFEPGEAILSTREYKRCFANIPKVVGRYQQPLNEINEAEIVPKESSLASQEERDMFIEIYSDMLENDPTNTDVLMKRARLYFEVHQFDLAVSDYTDVIRLDDRIHEAYFGRGMAHGRNGDIRKGIEDLSEYLRRIPDSSLAYTKRGVRYLWIGDEENAKKDLIQAIKLDPRNAEAHDDLGVIYARQGQHATALQHFEKTITIDPTYMKGHHNKAMVLYITGKNERALESVERALQLKADARGTLMLKAEILQALGQHKEAQRIRDKAEFLPAGNWSEQLSIQ
ncbi:MAG: tetratricopeptide repeat protein [Thioalkalispiraceae bacterium]